MQYAAYSYLPLAAVLFINAEYTSKYCMISVAANFESGGTPMKKIIALLLLLVSVLCSSPAKMTKNQKKAMPS